MCSWYHKSKCICLLTHEKVKPEKCKCPNYTTEAVYMCHRCKKYVLERDIIANLRDDAFYCLDCRQKTVSYANVR